MSGSVVKVLVWSAATVALAGCGGVSSTAIDATADPGPPASAPTTTTTPSRPNPHPCADETVPEAERVTATASYSPLPGPNLVPGAMPEGTTMYDIQHREQGRLRVGVDETTQGFAYRDPRDGEIKGMEVDLAYEIARRIFGDRPSDEILELVPVTTEEKIAKVASGEVDLTIDAISVSCKRWADVAFSTEYFTTSQQFLVPSGSPIGTTADLDGTTVCVTAGSSSISLLRDNVPDDVFPDLLEVGPRTDCLVALQQGDADAYFSHETFLRGMVLQDPTLEIRPVLVPTDDITSHYGIAIGRGNVDLVRFVNQALDEMRADRTLERLQGVLEEVPCRPSERSSTLEPDPPCSDRLGLLPTEPPVPEYLPEGS